MGHRCNSSSSHLLQAGTNDVFDVGLRAENIHRRSDRIVCLNLFETQRDERQDCVIDLLIRRGKPTLSATGFPSASCTDFVPELDDDALGGLFAYPEI